MQFPLTLIARFRRWPRLAPSYRLAAIAGLLSIANLPVIFAAPTTPRWWLLAVAVPAFCALSWRRVEPVLGWLFCASMAWAAVASIYNGYPSEGLLPFYFLILLGLCAVAAASVDDLTPALLALAVGAALNGALGVLQVLHWSPIPMFSDRPEGTFYNSEVLAEIVAPVFVWCVLTRRWFLAASLAVPLVLCQSKIALVGAVVGLSIGWVRRIHWRIALALAAVLVVFAAATFIDQPWEGPAAHRLTLWGTALLSLTPVGNGLGWWFASHPFGFEEFVHSDVLQIFLEAGVGGLFFLAIPIVIWWRGIQDRALGGLFAVLCFEACVSFPLHMPVTGFLFFVVAGWLAGARYRVLGDERARRISGDFSVRRQVPHRGSVASEGGRVGAAVRRGPAYQDDRHHHPARG